MKKFGAPSLCAKTISDPSRSEKFSLVTSSWGRAPKPPCWVKEKKVLSLAFSFASFLLGVGKRKEENLQSTVQLTRIFDFKLLLTSRNGWGAGAERRRFFAIVAKPRGKRQAIAKNLSVAKKPSGVET